jgi:hypothetical protein
LPTGQTLSGNAMNKAASQPLPHRTDFGSVPLGRAV